MQVGDTFTAVVAANINRTHLVMYAAASGDFHPVHHDDTVAHKMGFPSVFAHGMLTMGLAGRHLEEVVGRGTLTRYSAQLVAQVWPGDTLTSTITVTAIEDGIAQLELRAANQDAVGVLRGTAAARL
jgi:acyl dehydratase